MERVKWVKEAFSSNAIKYERGMMNGGIIINEIKIETIDGNDNYVGRDSEGEKVFQILVDAANVGFDNLYVSNGKSDVNNKCHTWEYRSLGGSFFKKEIWFPEKYSPTKEFNDWKKSIESGNIY